MSSSQVHAALDAFDHAFAAGDPADLADQFAIDGRLLLLHTDAIEGREAIRAHWERLFARYDTSAWQTTLMMIDVHGEQAYTIATYSETLIPRDGTPGQRQLVRGRLVRFLRHEDDGRWRVVLALNSHTRPVEQLD